MKLIIIVGTENARMLKELSELDKTDLLQELWPEILTWTPRTQLEQFNFGHSVVKRAATIPENMRIVVVTHSDHIFNGIRVGIKNSGVLDCKEVEILFCQPEKETIALYINNDGRVNHWPDGFFGQSEKALSMLLEP